MEDQAHLNSSIHFVTHSIVHMHGIGAKIEVYSHVVMK